MKSNSPQRSNDDGDETRRSRSNVSQARHQTLKGRLLFVVIAVADASATGMTPDFGGDEEEPESGCGQRRMLQRVHVGLRLAVKEHEPGVKVIGQHGQLKMIPVHVKAARW